MLIQAYSAQGRIEALSLQEPATRWWQTAIRWVWAEHGTQALITQIEHSSSRGLRGYRHANASAASSAHDPAGRLTQWADGPFKTTLAFNEHAQLSTLKTEAPERVGQAAQVGPTQAGAQAISGGIRAQAQSLSYDPFGRLREVQSAEQTQAFDYDGNGNRIGQIIQNLGSGQGSDTLSQLRFALAPQSDRLLAVQSNQGQTRTSFEYNSAGEPIRITSQGTPTKTLHYNALGQIGVIETAAPNGGQLLAHYAYNGARQRVAKTVYGQQQQQQETTASTTSTTTTTTYFTWHSGLLDAELDAAGRVQRRTIYFNLRPVALLVYGHAEQAQNRQAQSAQRFAIHGDHLGTPQAITDSAQRVVWLARFEAFGRATAQGLPTSEVTAQNRLKSQGWMGTAHAAAAQTGAGPDKPFEFHLRFAGQYEDTETGWHYNWHRFYDPDTGRYLTPDPIGLKGGDNAYGYAGGDPLGAVDPDGLRVIISGHLAAGFFGESTSPDSYHLSIVLIPDRPVDFQGDARFRNWSFGNWGGVVPRVNVCPGTTYMTVGGQLSLQPYISPFGTGVERRIVTEFNYGEDGPADSTWHQIVTSSLSDTELIRAIINAATSYRGNLLYSFPTIFGENSGYMAPGTYIGLTQSKWLLN